jgi:hypothetical protein
MAIVITRDNPEIAPELERPPGAPRHGLLIGGTITWDAAYPTGGEAFSLAALGLDDVLWAWVGPTDGFVFEYDYVNDKVLAWYQDSDAVADSALIQLADTSAALNAKVTRFLLVGVVNRPSA